MAFSEAMKLLLAASRSLGREMDKLLSLEHALGREWAVETMTLAKGSSRIAYSKREKLSAFAQVSTTSQGLVLLHGSPKALESVSRSLERVGNCQRSVGDFAKAVAEALKGVEGPYAVVGIVSGYAFASRDYLGRIPVFYSFENGLLTASTMPSALGLAGASKAKPLIPGKVLAFDGEELAKASVKELLPPTRKIEEMGEALERLDEALSSAIKEAAAYVSKPLLSFSGGLDSSVLARLLELYAAKSPKLLVTGFEGSWDIEWARQAAKLLGYELVEAPIDEERFEGKVAEVVENTGLLNPLDIEIATPLLAVFEEARSLGGREVFVAQGADELFCGYAKLLRVLEAGGYELLERASFELVKNLWRDNLDRDCSLALSLGLTLLAPYLDDEVVSTALSISPSLKVFSASDELRKRVLREYAKKIGVDERIADRRKKAIQYGSGASKELRKLAKRKGFRSVEQYLRLSFKLAVEVVR